MTKTLVDAGETSILVGVLAAGDVLVGLAGNTGEPDGAVLAVRTSAINDGTIALAAGPSMAGAYGLGGAALRNSGTLTNNGLIALGGGAYSAAGGGPVSGARLLNDGTLINAGAVVVGGATDGGAGTQTGTGAILRDNGVLTNTGTLSVAGETGGAGGAAGGAAAGTVVVAGTLDNSGKVELRGGTQPDFRGSTAAGSMLKVLATGTLANSGVLRIGASEGVSAAGGTLLDRGVLVNTGSILLGHQYTQYGYYAGTALLMIAAGGTLDNAGMLVAGAGKYGPYETSGGYGVVDAGRADQ